MDLRRLAYFAAVVNEGTVTAAAKALHISQPPLSAQLRLLEQEMGCTLFDRTTRRMRLTEAGRILYERATGILNLCASVEGEMKDLNSGFSGTIRIGAVSSTSSSVFLGWLKKYHELFPLVHFELFEANTYQLIENIRSNRIELAFVRTPFSAGDMQTVYLASEKLCAVALPHFFGEKASRVTLKDLSQKPLLIYRRWERILREAFQAESLHPEIFVVSDDARTTVKLSEEGFGIGIVPESAVTPAPGANISVMTVEHPSLTSEICAVYQRDRYISAPARRFLSLILEK